MHTLALAFEIKNVKAKGIFKYYILLTSQWCIEIIIRVNIATLGFFKNNKEERAIFRETPMNVDSNPYSTQGNISTE